MYAENRKELAMQFFHFIGSLALTYLTNALAKNAAHKALRSNYYSMKTFLGWVAGIGFK